VCYSEVSFIAFIYFCWCYFLSPLVYELVFISFISPGHTINMPFTILCREKVMYRSGKKNDCYVNNKRICLYAEDIQYNLTIVTTQVVLFLLYQAISVQMQ